jgi:rRNA maturation endonuclease Nob1
MASLSVYLLVLAAAVVAYLYARSTRRRTVCSSCGEVVRMEHDQVHHCPSCGAPLR